MTQTLRNSSNVYEMDWIPFWDYWQNVYHQDEHVSVIGPTGCGKTTLVLHGILPVRDWVCVFGTKPRDKQLSGLLRNGYLKLKRWPPKYPMWERHSVLWPDIHTMHHRQFQRMVFAEALSEIYETGGYAIYCDELHYLISELRLQNELSMIWQQGRSLNISLIAAMQRPSHVPLLAYSMATHLFFWRVNDETDLKRIGGIGWQDSRIIRDVVSQLYGPPKSAPRNKCCQFLYVNSRSGELIVSRYDAGAVKRAREQMNIETGV